MSVGLDLPSPNDYLAAVQNPRNCFADPVLASGETVMTPLGLPKVASGNFAVVFQVVAGQARYAVKCFTRRSEGQQRRYAAISRYLRDRKLPYFVDFAYLPQGIRIRGAFFPIVKMEWISGKLLHLFVEENLRRPADLTDLASHWRRCVADLVAARVAHGDLQHRNVVVQSSQVRLIDYDGMYVPTLQGESGTEAGHEHFQHPERRSTDFGDWRDHFAATVVYLSLRAVAADHSLWREFHLGENLIFSKTDYQRSGQTRIWGRLAQSSDEEVRRLALHLQAYCRMPIRQVPPLEQTLSSQAPPARVSVPAAGQGSSTTGARVDYRQLGGVLGAERQPATSPTSDAGSPAPAQPQTGSATRPRVDWELLRRIEESQRATSASRPPGNQSPPPATQGPPQQPQPTRRPSRPAQRQKPASQARSQPTRRPPPPPPTADWDARRRQVQEGLRTVDRGLSRLLRILLGLAMVAVAVTAVFLVGIYFAAGWVQANAPVISVWLEPLLQVIRDWVNTAIPAAEGAIRSLPGGTAGY